MKGKQEPTRRFQFLFDKVWREDILVYAYAYCLANGGAPGVDGETFARIEEGGRTAGSASYERRFGQHATNRSQ